MPKSKEKEAQLRQHKHELALAAIDLLKTDDELKYICMMISGIAGAAIISSISRFMEHHDRVQFFEELQENIDITTPPPGYGVPPSLNITPEHCVIPGLVVPDIIGALAYRSATPWDQLTDQQKMAIWQKYNTDLASAYNPNKTLFDNILAGAFGAIAGIGASCLVLKIMWNEGPPAGSGSVLASVGAVGISGLVGGAIGGMTSG